MSKYQTLWKCVQSIGSFPLELSFDEIEKIIGFSIDHSFITNKKEAEEYGFTVRKISKKEKFVVFDKN